jgi:agmatinase
VDFFDPSIMPGTGTPEPGGFLWYETIDFLAMLFEQRNVVGIDIVEHSPVPGLSHPDFMVAKLVYKLLGLIFLREKRKE